MADIKKIVLRHYVDEEILNEYILNLYIGVDYQSYQRYKLPEFKEGQVELYAEIRDLYGRDTIRINYDAQEVYKNGLIIYTSSLLLGNMMDLHTEMNMLILFQTNQEYAIAKRMERANGV